tara:strand:- start:2147 stop:2611 length:465 start_codon:yes stop_codon:yes gene_type:complete
MSEQDDEQTSLDSFDGSAPRKLNLPSQQKTSYSPTGTSSTRYHDMEKLYPDAPVPKVAGGLVIHRAVLHDLTGLPQLMDWVADGEAAIVRMEKMMNREVELQTAIERLNLFVESDLGGQIIRLTERRLMLLPPGCRGVKGVENEAFSVDTSEFN